LERLRSIHFQARLDPVDALELRSANSQVIRSAAKRTLERDSRHMSPRHADSIDSMIDTYSDAARAVTVTGSPIYRKVWGEQLTSKMRNQGRITSYDEAHWVFEKLSQIGESRAALESGTFGYPVPYMLQAAPFLVGPTDGIAPILDVCSKAVMGQGDTFHGVVASGNASASFVAEGQASTVDASLSNSTTGSAGNALVQVAWGLNSLRSTLPFSAEIGQDWGSMGDGTGSFLEDMGQVVGQACLATLAQTTCTGTGSAPQPSGYATQLAAATAGSPDIYSVAPLGTTTAGTMSAVDMRSVYLSATDLARARGSWIMSQGALDQVRALGVSGVSATTDLQFDSNARPFLLNRPVIVTEYAPQNLTSSTSGTAQWLSYVDLKGFLMVTKLLGTTIEVAPTGFSTTTGMPNLERYLIAQTRCTHGLVSPGFGRLLMG
jgi:HK97 family phage major capsid protein